MVDQTNEAGRVLKARLEELLVENTTLSSASSSISRLTAAMTPADRLDTIHNLAKAFFFVLGNTLQASEQAAKALVNALPALETRKSSSNREIKELNQALAQLGAGESE